MSLEKREPTSPHPTFGFYFKLIFLMVFVLFGAIILNTVIAKKNLRTTQINSKSLDSIKEFTSPEKWRKNIENEFRTNAGYKHALKNINTTSENVLGKATGIKDEVAGDVKNSVTDYVYDQTVVTMIKSLLTRMPERQQNNFKESFCKP